MERLIHTARGELKLDLPFYYVTRQKVKIVKNDPGQDYFKEGDIAYITEAGIERTKREVKRSGNHDIPKYVRIHLKNHPAYGNGAAWVLLTTLAPVDD